MNRQSNRFVGYFSLASYEMDLAHSGMADGIDGYVRREKVNAKRSERASLPARVALIVPVKCQWLANYKYFYEEWY